MYSTSKGKEGIRPDHTISSLYLRGQRLPMRNSTMITDTFLQGLELWCRSVMMQCANQEGKVDSTGSVHVEMRET